MLAKCFATLALNVRNFVGLAIGHWLLQFRSTISVSTHRSMSLSTDGLIALILVSLAGFSVAAQSITLDDVRAQMAAGQHQAALAEVETFLKDNPGHVQARFLKGVVLTEQERTVEAIEVFSAIAADFPALPEPHDNLAVLYASSGDYVKARDALLMAINTHPSYATAHESLGDIYAKMAGLAYDRVLQLDTENVSAKAKHRLDARSGFSRATARTNQYCRRYNSSPGGRRRRAGDH
jgi:tetratricopeptide (TPR) repeat protein